MKHLDADKLFDILLVGDHQVYQEHGVEQLVDDTHTLFGSVIKGVENYYIIDQMYTNRYGEAYNSVREKLRVKYFTNLMRYLVTIDMSRSDTRQNLVDEFGLQPISYALNEMIDCFVQVEQYEKCAILQKFIEVFNVINLQPTQ